MRGTSVQAEVPRFLDDVGAVHRFAGVQLETGDSAVSPSAGSGGRHAAAKLGYRLPPWPAP
jgi:hypothetical protein